MAKYVSMTFTLGMFICGIVEKFRLWHETNLSELINFYSPLNLTISGQVDVNQLV